MFVGNTTMDATLSFVMANMAQCQPNHITLDPFCGTGGLDIFQNFIFTINIAYI